MSCASFADLLSPASGPVTDSQYPVRMDEGLTAILMSSSGSSTPSGFTSTMAGEELRLPGKRNAAGPAMFEEYVCEASDGFFASPIALPLGGNGQPCDRHGAGSLHSLHPHIVGLHRSSARGVGHKEH